MDESTFNFRDIRSTFSFLFKFSMKFLSANRIAPDGTPRFAASHLGLFCLLMSHKKDPRLIRVKVYWSAICIELKLSKLVRNKEGTVGVGWYFIFVFNF